MLVAVAAVGRPRPQAGLSARRRRAVVRPHATGTPAPAGEPNGATSDASGLGSATSAAQRAAAAAGDLAAAAAAAAAGDLAAPAAATTAPDGAGGRRGSAAEAERVKWALLALLASLDRGFAATADEAERVEALCRELQELQGGPVMLSWEKTGAAEAVVCGWWCLDGRWRLLYSSGFASGSLGGRRPGPQAALVPLQLGQVYQDIISDLGELDNVVDLGWRGPSLAWVLPPERAAAPTAHARLRHRFQVVGHSTVEITFESTEVRLSGGLGGWLDSLPNLQALQLPEGLRPPVSTRTARFDVAYLSDDLRITRGDKGELRVFIKGEH
eukprot:scaffold19.g1775.t1